MPEIAITKILLPVDFSAKAEDAAQYAAQLARHFHSELILVHVLEPPNLDFAMAELAGAVEQIAKAQRERALTRLNHFASADFDGLRVTRQIAQGQPAEEILAAAKGVDLVVMPTQGHGRFRKFLIGSVTAKILHDCLTPVLTGIHLSGNPRQDWGVKNLLCAIDFGPESHAVLSWGARLAAEFGSKVSVVHAGTDPGAVETMDRFVRAVGLSATPIIVPGEAHNVVPAAAQLTSADLLVIGRGSSPETTGRLRPQAYEIVRKSPCPVLSV